MHSRPATLAALVAAAAAMIAPAGALAHAGIKSLTPKPGSTVTGAVTSVRIAFKARVADGNLTVENAAGAKVSRGSGRLNGKHRAIRARLRSRPAHGRYTATARWLDTDGHVETKTWSFHVR